MKVYFLTGNQGKIAEAKAIIPEIESLNIDLPEIQSLDAHEIIQAKLEAAFAHQTGEFIVEDTSLYYEGQNGLPGPLIKWFLESIGTEGLYKFAQSFDVKSAQVKTVIGYAKNLEQIHFFEGSIEGEIVRPTGNKGFGFDSIFRPKGFNMTFAELSLEEKNRISHRKIAFTKLAEFLAE